MPQTVLGLDIGQSTIKAVLLHAGGLTGGRILDARILNTGDYGSVKEALEMLAGDKNFSNVPCCVCLPLTDVMLRHVSLPFRDENRIRKTLAFELEPLIPVPVEDVVTDYLIMPRGGLLVGTLAKHSVREWIENVEGPLGEAAFIDLSATALAAQVIHEKKSASCGIILDIGHSSTTVSFYENDALIHVRSLAFGGQNITQALATELSLDTDEAELWKTGKDHAGPPAGAEEACRRFCAKLQNTIEYMKINGILQSEPSHITLTGGGSLFAPLCRALENY